MGGVERRRYSALSSTGDAPVRDGVDGKDANAKTFGDGAVKGRLFYGREEENYNSGQAHSIRELYLGDSV